MEFRNPFYLYIAIPAVITVIISLLIRSSGRVKFPWLGNTGGLPPSRFRRAWMPCILRIIVLILLVIALAGPRAGVPDTKKFQYGTDIVLAIDVSSRMTREDFSDGAVRVSHLDAVKSAILKFIDGRKNNRIGLIVFSEEAWTICPLTLDYRIVRELAEGINAVDSHGDEGTSTGLGIATAVNRLRKSAIPSKAVIVFSNSTVNKGWLSPENASELAIAEGVPVFVIFTRSQRITGRNHDTVILERIAVDTGGKYFHVEDVESLNRAIGIIDRTKGPEIEEPGYGKYIYFSPAFIFAAFGLYFIELLIRNTLFMTLP